MVLGLVNNLLPSSIINVEIQILMSAKRTFTRAIKLVSILLGLTLVNVEMASD